MRCCCCCVVEQMVLAATAAAAVGAGMWLWGCSSSCMAEKHSGACHTCALVKPLLRRLPDRSCFGQLSGLWATCCWRQWFSPWCWGWKVARQMKMLRDWLSLFCWCLALCRVLAALVSTPAVTACVLVELRRCSAHLLCCPGGLGALSVGFSVVHFYAKCMLLMCCTPSNG